MNPPWAGLKIVSIFLVVAALVTAVQRPQREASATEPDDGSSQVTKDRFPLMRSGKAPKARKVKPVALGIEKYQSLVLPALKRYCVDCHGPNKQKGKIRFDTAPAIVDTAESLHFWQEALDMLNIGDMPPKDQKQVPTPELTEILGTVSRAVSRARSYLASQDVVTPMRRLNKREYLNTLRDLLGVEANGDGLPNDDAFEGFDTTAGNLSLSPMQWEQYNRIALDVVSRVLAENQYDTKPKSVTETIEGEDVRRKEINAGLEEQRKDRQYYNKMADALKKHGGDAEEAVKHFVNNKGEKYSSAKSFKKAMAKYKKRGGPGIYDTYHDEYPSTDTGAILSSRRGGFTKMLFGLDRVAQAANEVHSGRVRVKVTCVRVGNEEAPAFLKVVQGSKAFGGLVGVFPVGGTMEDPKEIEFEVAVDLRGREEVGEAIAARLTFTLVDGKDMKSKSDPSLLWIDKVECVGPFYDTWPTRGYRELLGDGARAAMADEPSVRETLRKFAERAFRSQSPSDAFLDRLMGMYREGKKRGVSDAEAIAPAFASILASPKFLYLVEERSTEERRWVDDSELANRLSYFLWSSMPDERLIERANSGELHRPEVLAKEVDRMVQDPKFGRFAESFFHQWFELNRLNDVEISAKAFPKYSDEVKRSSYAETYEFFAHLFRNDLSVLNTIKSDFVVVDRILAEFYDLPRPEGEGFRAVRLPKGSRQGGFLTQSSFLTMTTNGDRTSPVDRGAFVLRKFLDEPRMSPPPNVPQLPERGKKEEQPPIRQLMSAHMTQAQCAHCHRKIDPLGYAFERFNTVGLWREFEGSSKEPIDTSGTMPGGERSFSDFEGLQSFLLEDRRLFLRSMVKAVMSYGLGREVSFQDDDLVEQIVEYVTLNDYSARSLLHAIVMSEAFHLK